MSAAIRPGTTHPTHGKRGLEKKPSNAAMSKAKDTLSLPYRPKTLTRTSSKESTRSELSMTKANVRGANGPKASKPGEIIPPVATPVLR